LLALAKAAGLKQMHGIIPSQALNIGGKQHTGMAFKDAYAAAAAKYKLPSYDALHAEMDLSECEFEDYPLRQVLHVIKDRMDGWLDVIEIVLSPDQASTAALYEANAFSESDQKALFKLFSKVMYNYRILTEAAVLMDEKADVEAIRSVWKAWADLKKQVAALAAKIKQSWTRELKGEDHQGYLG
jgi:hypothetical protein